MLKAADRQQGFFDAAWCADLLPADSIYALLAEHGDRIVRDEDFAECYSQTQGRPSIAPSVLAKVLLLAYRHGLSDQGAMDAVRFDLRWKVALDLPVDHPGFHATSLVRFRARLLLHGKERLVFERSIQLASELGLLEGPAEQIVDSTPMLGAAAVQDTAVLVRTAVGKLIDAVRAVDAQAAGVLGDALRFEYVRPREKPAGNWADRKTRTELLGEVARDAQRALRAVQADDELIEDATVAEAAGVLGEIIGQEYALDDDDGPRPRQAHPPHRLRPGRRDASRPPDTGRRFTGYKLHAAVAADAPIVTAISIAPANEHDGHHAGGLVDQQPQQRRPERLIGDTAYGNSEVREDLAQRSVRVLAPVHSSSPKSATIPKEAFAIDLESDTVTCPEGHTTAIYKPRANRRTTGGERVARVARSDCEPCPCRVARPAASATSASDAAKISAKPPCRPSPIPCSMSA